MLLLRLGRALPAPVVSVDPVEAVDPARQQWRLLSARRGVPVAFIEVVCSDRSLHRRRLEQRRRDIEGFPEPTWAAVEQQRAEFEPRSDPRLVLDSAADLDANVARALDYLRAR